MRLWKYLFVSRRSLPSQDVLTEDHGLEILKLP